MREGVTRTPHPLTEESPKMRIPTLGSRRTTAAATLTLAAAGIAGIAMAPMASALAAPLTLSATSGPTGITCTTLSLARSIFTSLGAPGRIFSLPGAPGSSTQRLPWSSGTIDWTQTKWSATDSSLARALRHLFHRASG